MDTNIVSMWQITVMLEVQSLFDWCDHMMQLLSGATEDPEDDTVMEMLGARTLYSVVKCLMPTILPEVT